MTLKAIFFDLDNTIYPVSSIGDELFKPLHKLIGDSGELEDADNFKADMQRKPFQQVAKDHGLSEKTIQKATDLLQEMTCDMPMTPFPGYDQLRTLPLRKFLITAGFTKMQSSKVERLDLEKDMEAIHIIDPMLTNDNKKTRFAQIATDEGFAPQEVLVVGDDNASEIQAARELGMKAVLYDSLDIFPDVDDVPRIASLKELASFIDHGK